ncbi:DUF488 domain-containing protein [Luteimonas vadosa]|uniref:DUF488 domain-containing protein n=1 Tax=Luteimonas vadosa TaxID=1165507 RepID=A0ABP9E3F8_9GAMM
MRTLWTIGHSTRDWRAFVDMLQSAGITTLADVRRFAGSRRHPHFGGETMRQALPAAGIGYLALPELGGRRPPREGSGNTAWRNAAFRGYADYMQQPEYADARGRLEETAARSPTAVLCAEAVWWRCHRGLIADDFKVRGWEVLHLLAPGNVSAHPYTSAASIVDGRLHYGRPPDAQPDLF